MVKDMCGTEGFKMVVPKMFLYVGEIFFVPYANLLCSKNTGVQGGPVKLIFLNGKAI